MIRRCLLVLTGCILLQAGGALAEGQTVNGGPFKVGERLTYTVAFERFDNVAYVELFTASRGRIGEVEAVELRSRIKTLDFVSAAIYMVDESRTIYVSPDSGVPLYLSRTVNVGGLPKETIQNNLSAPTGNFDLVTMIYKIRHSDGAGTFNILEGDKIYNVTFQLTGNEKVRTDAGEFETTTHTIQSEYFAELGIRDVRMNLSIDAARVPVSLRFRTPKGDFIARLASVRNVEPVTDPSPTPAPISTPKPTPEPTPSPTPRAYEDNQPLSSELAFELWETLEYRLSAAGEALATFVLRAAERKQVDTLDTLFLSAYVKDVMPVSGPLSKNDSILVQVDPVTLGPRKFEVSLSGPLAAFSQEVFFDERRNLITFKNGGSVEAPVGTHSVLSLLYAMRSFNLKPSKDTTNPINDTRVAVFWENRPYIFTLRPSMAESITVGDQKISAQMVSITTGNKDLDGLAIKVWLSTDDRRLPVRITLGRYQADLISSRVLPPK
ncbi:MAG: DUF3108 domain-containing protein [Chloracidobacterium sp.]|nr:DUF3108 domain-containing protein [Chloracidobacterium sp.]